MARVRPCPVCGRPLGPETAEIAVGPAYVKICGQCADSGLHLMRVLGRLLG